MRCAGAGAALLEARQAGLAVIVKEAMANGRLTPRNTAPSMAAKLAALQAVADKVRRDLMGGGEERTGPGPGACLQHTPHASRKWMGRCADHDHDHAEQAALPCLTHGMSDTWCKRYAHHAGCLPGGGWCHATAGCRAVCRAQLGMAAWLRLHRIKVHLLVLCACACMWCRSSVWA